MAIDKLKVAFIYRVGKFGITESLLYNPGLDFTGAEQEADKLVKKRLAASGFGLTLDAIRISRTAATRESKIILGSAYTAPASAVINSSDPTIKSDNSSDQANAALKLRLQLANGSFATRYLAGLPDALLREAPTGPAVAQFASLWQKVQQYQNALVVQGAVWAVGVRAPRTGQFAPRPVLALARDATTGLLLLTVPATGTAYAPNDKVQLRGFLRKNNGYVKLNGMWRIATATASGASITYALQQSLAVDPLGFRRNGTIEAIDYVASAITSSQVTGQTTRRRGGRFFLPLGRRSQPR